jgi:hypothetical protein
MAANQNSDQGQAAGNGNVSCLDSEIQLVSSLAKLQELERKVCTCQSLPSTVEPKLTRYLDS